MNVGGPWFTEGMTALADATREQAALAALTEMLVELERTISSLQAARDGILAVGSRLALEVAEQAEHPDQGRCLRAPSPRSSPQPCG